MRKLKAKTKTIKTIADLSYTVSVVQLRELYADKVPVEVRIRAGAQWQPHLIEMNIRGFLSDLEYATSGDILEGWEDITVFEDVLEQVVVAETCKASSAVSPTELLANDLANGTNPVKLEEADIEIHPYTMSSEADGTIAGELSGKPIFPAEHRILLITRRRG